MWPVCNWYMKVCIIRNGPTSPAGTITLLLLFLKDSDSEVHKSVLHICCPNPLDWLKVTVSHLSPIVHVALVAQDHLLYVRARVLLDVPDPVLDVVEALLVGDVVDEHDTHGSAVVGRGDGPESLLSRCVPDLQLDLLAVELDRPDLEVDACEREVVCYTVYSRDTMNNTASPMVEMKVALKASSENLKRTQVLPTPESPMRSSLNR